MCGYLVELIAGLRDLRHQNLRHASLVKPNLCPPYNINSHSTHNNTTHFKLHTLPSLKHRPLHIFTMHRTYSMRQSRAPTASQIQNPPPPSSSTKAGRFFGRGNIGQFICEFTAVNTVIAKYQT
jgi:hypothetical protein